MNLFVPLLRFNYATDYHEILRTPCHSYIKQYKLANL